MKLARYVGNGRVEIVEEPTPKLPPGGIVLRTLASGLCSGELMDWYMDRKLPHVLGHEIAGTVVETDNAQFPLGCLVVPHHHAPCLECDACRSGNYVHCPTWKRTKLDPGGMCETVAVSKENLTDSHIADGLRPIDAALCEPLACVMKSISRGQLDQAESVAVIGLGVMGLLHLAVLGDKAWGIDISPKRTDWAVSHGFRTHEHPTTADAVVVCPGSPAAFERSFEIVRPGGTIVMFAPFGPTESYCPDWNAIYFKEIRVVPAYSCGPNDMVQALGFLRTGKFRAESVVSDFVTLDELPEAYLKMKRGEILKSMVLFGDPAPV